MTRNHAGPLHDWPFPTDDRLYGLSGSAWAVLFFLWRHAQPFAPVCKATIAQISTETGFERGTVYRATVELKDRGFVHAAVSDSDGRGLSYRLLWVNPSRELASEPSFTEHPDVVVTNASVPQPRAQARQTIQFADGPVMPDMSFARAQEKARPLSNAHSARLARAETIPEARAMGELQSARSIDEHKQGRAPSALCTPRVSNQPDSDSCADSLSSASVPITGIGEWSSTNPIAPSAKGARRRLPTLRRENASSPEHARRWFYLDAGGITGNWAERFAYECPSDYIEAQIRECDQEQRIRASKHWSVAAGGAIQANYVHALKTNRARVCVADLKRVAAQRSAIMELTEGQRGRLIYDALQQPDLKPRAEEYQAMLREVWLSVGAVQILWATWKRTEHERLERAKQALTAAPLLPRPVAIAK